LAEILSREIAGTVAFRDGDAFPNLNKAQHEEADELVEDGEAVMPWSYDLFVKWNASYDDICRLVCRGQPQPGIARRQLGIQLGEQRKRLEWCKHDWVRIGQSAQQMDDALRQEAKNSSWSLDAKEAGRLHGSSDDTAFVRGLYQDILGRTPSAAEVGQAVEVRPMLYLEQIQVISDQGSHP